jgi:hypothetical protein
VDTLLASAVVAATVSGFVTLLTPWAQWRVERRKLAVQHQRESIKEWREGLEAWEAENGGSVATSPASFIKERWYFSLPSLSGCVETPRSPGNL